MRASITCLPGDGIGPEVVEEGVRILQAVADGWGHSFSIDFGLVGGAAIDATGSPLPNETLERCSRSDAVLLGAVGGPKWDDPAAKVRPEQGLLALRKALGLFANLRPVSVHPVLAPISPVKAERLAGVDLLVVRELTGGLYFGEKSRTRLADGSEQASDHCTYTTHEVERVTRVAGELARLRKRRIVSIDKANVLETSRLWRQTVARVMEKEFPDVALSHALVDSCAMQLIQAPANFDVVLTENLFGDILTDEVAVLAGSIGVLPSASLGERTGTGVGATRLGLYEPIHGSAPDLVGQGAANPIGTILSVAMLLRYSLGLEAEARAVEASVHDVISAGIGTRDIVPVGTASATTSQVGGAIAERLAARAAGALVIQ